MLRVYSSKIIPIKKTQGKGHTSDLVMDLKILTPEHIL